MDTLGSEELLLSIAPGGTDATAVPTTSLEDVSLLERQHLQEWVVAHPAILGPGVMIVAVEYDGWVVSGGAQRDRLDVLGLDADGRLVVVEIKRGVVPDTVEMQAVKYAAMASRFRLQTLAAAYSVFASRRGTPLTVDEAAEALQTHADVLSDETLADPRVVLIAQGFTPIVISSIVWLANRGVDISLVRFQPYRQASGEVFVTFSRLFPLPDLEKSIVVPGTPAAEIPATQLPTTVWTTADLVRLGRLANLTSRAALDLCADAPDAFVSLTEIVKTAGVTRPAARAQLAGLTMTIKAHFGRGNWPFAAQWAADGTSQAFYTMTATEAERWHEAANELDAEEAHELDAEKVDDTVM